MKKAVEVEVDSNKRITSVVVEEAETATEACLPRVADEEGVTLVEEAILVDKVEADEVLVEVVEVQIIVNGAIEFKV